MEVTRASGLDASWTTLWGGVVSMSHWAVALGKTQDTPERLRHSAGLGTPLGPPKGTGGSDREEESLSIFAIKKK